MNKLKAFFEWLKRKIKWTELVSFCSMVLLPYLKKNLSAILLKVFKVSGGVWSWIFSTIILEVMEKFLLFIKKEAVKQDKENVDEIHVEKYEKEIKDGGTVEDTIKNGSDFLNGSKP